MMKMMKQRKKVKKRKNATREYETKTEKLWKCNPSKGGECGGGRETSGRGSAGVGRVAWWSITTAKQWTEGEAFESERTFQAKRCTHYNINVQYKQKLKLHYNIMCIHNMSSLRCAWKSVRMYMNIWKIEIELLISSLRKKANERIFKKLPNCSFKFQQQTSTKLK